MCIINIGNETQKCVAIINLSKTLHCLSKLNVVPLFYSLLVQSMYITVNKATFTVVEIINPIIRNSKKFTINTTSLSDSKAIL